MNAVLVDVVLMPIEGVNGAAVRIECKELANVLGECFDVVANECEMGCGG